MKLLFNIFSVLVFLVIAANLLAQSSSNITYQGKLTDASGKPVADGSQSVTFKIYDGSGQMVWTETQSVSTKSGIFEVKLGANTPLPSPFPQNAELEISVGGTPLSPRTKFTSSAYSLGLSHGYVGALNLNGHIVGGNGDTVTINPGSNVAFVFDNVSKATKIEAGGNPSTVTGVQPGKYLVGGGTAGVVTLGLQIPLLIDENETADLVTIANHGTGRAFTASAHGNCAAGFFETVGPGNANTTLKVTNNGKGIGMLVEGANAASTETALTITNSGMGSSMLLSAMNPTGNGPAFDLKNSGIGTSLAISANNINGTGTVFDLKNFGTATTASISYENVAGNTKVVDIKNAGIGNAVYIQQTNVAANAAALEVQNTGIGVGARIVSTNKDGDAAALEGESRGKGAGVHGINPGKGRAGLFENYAGSITEPTVEIISNGEPGNGLLVRKTGDQGSAGYFWNTKINNTTDALFAVTSGSGSAVSGNGGGHGSAGRFVIDTIPNQNNTINVSTKGTGNAGHFFIDNPSNTKNAIFGETNGEGTGVFGSSTHDNGTGVYGSADKPQSIGVFGGTAEGLSGVSGRNGKSGDGVTGVSALGVGVNGKSDGQSPTSDGVLGNSTASQAAGVHGIETKADAYGVHGFNALGYGVYGETVSGTGVCAYGGTSGIAINVNGKFIQSGGVFQASPTSTVWTTNKPATVKLHNGNKVKLFAEEASEVFFNDYGSGSLQNGKAHISLDPKFLETVTIDEAHPLKVFIQLEGDCNGVYVMNKTKNGFDVAELHGGNSNAPFSYRIVCKRKYYEDERLASEEEDIQFNSSMLKKAWPEEIQRQDAVTQQIKSAK